MTQDLLEKLGDDELRAVAAQCETLLKKRDAERKEKAISDARTLLISVGLNLKDVVRKSPAAKPKGVVYKSGHTYQHPANKTLTWPGKGKKPTWLTALEAEGGKAVEVAANDNAPMPARKTA